MIVMQITTHFRESLNHLPGVSFRIFCSGREPNVKDGCRFKMHFSGEYVPGAEKSLNEISKENILNRNN